MKLEHGELMATGICQLLLPQADVLKSCCELILRHQTRAQCTHTHTLHPHYIFHHQHVFS